MYKTMLHALVVVTAVSCGRTTILETLESIDSVRIYGDNGQKDVFLSVHDTIQLRAYAYWNWSGTRDSVPYFGPYELSWVSRNKAAVESIDKQGRIRGVASGEAIVVVTVADRRDSLRVTVR